MNDETNQSGSKRSKALLAGGVVLAVLVIGAVLYWLHARKYESTDDAFVDAHIVRIAPQVSGTVSKVAVKSNQHVSAGDLLVTIQSDQAQAQLQQSLAAEAQARAQLAAAQASVTAAQSQFSQAQANTLAPAARVVEAQKTFDRLQALQQQDSQAIAPSRIDQARSALDQAKGATLAARRAVQAMQTQVASARQQVSAAEAALKVTEARVSQAQIDLGHYNLTASVAGHISKLNVNVGSYVSPGTQMMALVPDHMWVTANFKETQIDLIHPGQPVDIKVDAFPGVHFKGVVDSIQRGSGQAFQLLPPENASGNFVKVVQRVPVRILFTDPQPDKYPIGPGMSVTPSIKVR